MEGAIGALIFLAVVASAGALLYKNWDIVSDWLNTPSLPDRDPKLNALKENVKKARKALRNYRQQKEIEKYIAHSEKALATLKEKAETGED